MATSNATYVQRGEALDYTNSTEAVIPAGSVISLTTRIGVAGTNIAPGAVGSVHVVGVFSMDKTDSEEVAMGDALYFDTATGKITKTGKISKTGTSDTPPAGYAAAPSAAAETTVLVNIGYPPAPVAAAAG